MLYPSVSCCILLYHVVSSCIMLYFADRCMKADDIKCWEIPTYLVMKISIFYDLSLRFTVGGTNKLCNLSSGQLNILVFWHEGLVLTYWMHEGLVLTYWMHQGGSIKRQTDRFTAIKEKLWMLILWGGVRSGHNRFCLLHSYTAAHTHYLQTCHP